MEKRRNCGSGSCWAQGSGRASLLQQQCTECKKMLHIWGIRVARKMPHIWCNRVAKVQNLWIYFNLLFRNLRFMYIIVFVALQFCKFCNEHHKPWAWILWRHIRVSYIVANIVQITPQAGPSLVPLRETGVSYIALISCKLLASCEKYGSLYRANIV